MTSEEDHVIAPHVRWKGADHVVKDHRVITAQDHVIVIREEIRHHRVIVALRHVTENLHHVATEVRGTIVIIIVAAVVMATVNRVGREVAIDGRFEIFNKFKLGIFRVKFKILNLQRSFEVT